MRLNYVSGERFYLTSTKSDDYIHFLSRAVIDDNVRSTFFVNNINTLPYIHDGGGDSVVLVVVVVFWYCLLFFFFF